MRISVKKEKRKNKNLVGCGRVGTWMHCVQTDEGKEKKRKEKPWMMVVDVGRWECRCIACADVLHVRIDAYEQKKKKRTKKLTMGLPRMCTQRHGHADHRVGMWTQMCCMRMWMSIKEKEEEKTYFVDADGGCVGLQMCCVLTCWHADADAGGCWWWTCMSVEKKRKKKLT